MTIPLEAVILVIEKVLLRFGQPFELTIVIAVLVREPAVTSFLPE